MQFTFFTFWTTGQQGTLIICLISHLLSLGNLIFPLLSSLVEREEDFSHIIGCLDPNKFYWSLDINSAAFPLIHYSKYYLRMQAYSLQVMEITGRNNTPEKEESVQCQAAYLLRLKLKSIYLPSHWVRRELKFKNVPQSQVHYKPKF